MKATSCCCRRPSKFQATSIVKVRTARAVVARVDNKNNNPKIILSRTSPVFLQRLFEMEVPEINDGLITIKKIARIPGERAKIAVEIIR